MTYRNITAFLLGLLLTLMAGVAFAAPTVTCVAPTENVDGSPLTDLAGYRTYAGAASRTYSDMTEMMDPLACGAPIDLNLGEGSWFIAMTALDEQGNESAYSNEIIKGVVIEPLPPVIQ